MGLREPTRLMAKLAARLFESAAEQEAFLHALTHPGERLQGVIWNSTPSLQGGELGESPSSGEGDVHAQQEQGAGFLRLNHPAPSHPTASARVRLPGGGGSKDPHPAPLGHRPLPASQGEASQVPPPGRGRWPRPAGDGGGNTVLPPSPTTSGLPPLGGEDLHTRWLPTWAEVRSTKERLGQTPEHERGDIYLLDASSLFTASCLLAIPEAKSALDLCASPGGKAIYGYRHLTPERFVCNEVIGKRHAALISNLRRCGILAEVTQRDAKDIDEMFDAVWVDAPCSGQSLLAMGKDAHGAFHPNIINMNANRQKRIVANAAQWVNPGGWLAYMTCTFSPDENEGVIQWFLARNPEWRIVPVPHLATHAKEVGYQLYPHQGHGAGGYCCLLRAPF